MLVCAQCGQPNPDGSKFCNACGALVEERQIGEERRIVSALFVDLVGFTSRAETLDPEDVRDILTPYYEHVREELERHGGLVEKFVGDAVMGVFGAPTAFGDDPDRAVRAAFAVRDWAELKDLQVRIAVNTGEAIVGLRTTISLTFSLPRGSDLVRREAVSRIQGDQQFAFKHALIQEVSYLRRPRAARRERHAAVAAFLEETTGDSGQSTEAIAEHWREAGENALWGACSSRRTRRHAAGRRDTR